MKHLFFMTLLAGSLVTAAPAGAQKITVAGGDFDRENTVVTFALPQSDKARVLRAPDGTLLPLQSEGGEATFVLPRLAKNQTQTFEIVPATAKIEAIEAKRDGTVVKFSLHGKPVLSYQAEPGTLPRPDIKAAYARGGYISPVFSPSGRLVTDDFPPNHIHHHGIWFPWTKTEFEGRHPDFWNMGAETGRVEFVALDRFFGGAVFGGFQAQHRFVDLKAQPAKTALSETWDVKIYNASDKRWIFDMTSMQQCATDSPLKLPKYHYGGLGIRGHRDWNGAGKADFLTSENVRGTAADETRGKWCFMGGPVDGQKTGIAVLCHPSNFRAPQPFRAHPSEPFLCLAPSQLGDWEIKPGEKYVSRYRFVVADGAPDADALNRQWNDFAHPPKVTIETP